MKTRKLRTVIASCAAALLALTLAAPMAAAQSGPEPDLTVQSGNSLGGLQLGGSRADAVGDGLIQPMSATGTQPIGSFNYSLGPVTVKVPAGCFLTHIITGGGVQVNRDRAGVDCVGLAATNPSLFCNYQFKFVYRDQQGKVYRTKPSPIYSSCKSQIPVFDAPAPFTGKKGTACVEFWVNAVKRTQQCHSITA